MTSTHTDEKIIKLAAHFGIEPITTTFGPFGGYDCDAMLDAVMAKLEAVPYIPYPVSLATVDVILFKVVGEGKAQILLGQKEHEHDTWRLPGGFREPTHNNEFTVLKETNEETNVVLPDVQFNHYLGSFFINDRRYINSCHKVTTSLFAVNVDIATEAVGGDDLPRVKWFDLEEVKSQLNTLILPEHQQLVKHFLKVAGEI